MMSRTHIAQSHSSTRSRSRIFRAPTRQSYYPPKLPELDLEDISEVDLTLMTLRKPTDLKKVIDSIPRPLRAVPKNGLPRWYRLGLECKLPCPKMPQGKIIFSRGRIGEDILRVGLGTDCPRPSFDLSDPYGYDINYVYDSMHDPHMQHHYNQKPARSRMKQLGFCTDDNRAVCSLKQFNEYRKYLYSRFMDRIHMEMRKLDERAKDDQTLKNVEKDVARQAQAFNRAERSRELQEKHARVHAEELAEKRRLAKEQAKKIAARLRYLDEYNERMRKERADKALERQTRIKQRVQAAAELELRRKITMVRNWRINDKRRLNRLMKDAEAKKARQEKEAEDKWNARVENQNYKIQEEQTLLRLYQEDMTAGALRRTKRAEIYAYNTDLDLQRIKLINWKELHGETKKRKALVRKMGIEFEKSKRGAKGMSPEKAQAMAAEAMSSAVSTVGDVFMTLGIARAKMDIATILPTPPIKILEMLLEGAVLEFTRRRVHLLLKDVEREVRTRAAKIFFKNFRPSMAGPRRSHAPRWSIQLTTALAHQYADTRGTSIAFGDTFKIAPDAFTDQDLKSVRDRPPTPVPSVTRLAEVTFTDKVEDLPNPTTHAASLPERRRLLEMVNASAKLLSRSVSSRVQKGMDINLGKVTLPFMKHPLEWGEAVESLSDAVVNNRINADCPELRHVTLFLTQRILKNLQLQMKNEKIIRKQSIAGVVTSEERLAQQKDFYDPNEKPKEDFYVPGEAPKTPPAGQGDQGAPIVSMAAGTK